MCMICLDFEEPRVVSCLRRAKICYRSELKEKLHRNITIHLWKFKEEDEITSNKSCEVTLQRKMSENVPSAFSMHARLKSAKHEIKIKNKPLLSKVSHQKCIKQKSQKQPNKKDKRALNISVKSRNNINKKGNLKICSLPEKLVKVTNKFKKLNRIQQLNEINNVQSTREKLKVTKKQKKKIEKKICENERNTIIETTIETILRKNDEKENNDNHSNDIESDKNMLIEQSNITYFGNPNPILTSQKLFQWLVHPLNVKDFFIKHWERNPIHIKRKISDYYKWIVSTSILDKILRDNHILFTKNIDITSYVNGVRETHNPPGRALPSVVWDYYLNDCSVRMLNPQTFIPQLHALNATLQELFGCFVGANLYLTPPNSQGFAPHYDDIEAFILQIEGKKRWRLYMPPNENEYLPRYSSKNFDQSEIGEPILDTIVSAGDMLYLPRGTIHQGTTIDDSHSLHVTLSVYQKNSWCDLLEKLLPQTLKRAVNIDSRFREGLPLEYLRYTGIAHSTNTTEQKIAFKEQIKDLITNLINYIDVDSAADLMAKDHIHDFLPPFLNNDEQKCSVMEDGEIMTSNGIVKNRTDITLETQIRLLRMHCIRLIEEDGIYRIYYSTENSKEYHEYEPQFLEIDAEFVPSIQKIITSYPNFIYVKELPIENDDIKVQIVKDLWEKSLVITHTALCLS
ncbi:ribosomal oxygenase 1 [Nylanderia fulva]|uniref:ribosomal oxygenase 1 n=1 Tax=Nylanderia fulva TaxID=613905 RepID=UPI0010FB965F|nr:ribosomal oxygenase 1 [Nylanderia fulva]